MKRFISWNVNGIRAVYRKGFLDWFKKESPDYLCLQETKANVDQLPFELTTIENYTSYFSSAQKKGYSGTALYSDDMPIEVLNSFDKENKDTEGRIIIAKYKKFTLMNLYYPNGKGGPERLKYKLKFYSDFLKYIKDRPNENFIVCGDVNTAHNEIDLARPKENSKVSGFLKEEREWLDKFINDASLVDTFRHFNKDPNNYTWWDQKSRARERNVGWRIDYFYISKKLLKNLVSSNILTNVYGSDHCPVEITIDI